MTRDDIIAMAREAWQLEFIPEGDVPKLARFAALVAAEKDREIEWLREALKMIAGESPCIDNLMSDKDIARAALRQEGSK